MSSLGPSFYPRGGSIGGSVKLQGPRSLQILRLGPVSGVSVHVSNSNGHVAKESAGSGSEDLLDSSPGRSKQPWWAFIFKFSDNHDLHSNDRSRATTVAEGIGTARRVTVFTDEKARVLRRELRETETWHDLMYHSAIASRLALPDDNSAA